MIFTKSFVFTIFMVLILLHADAQVNSSEDLTQYVDALIGTFSDSEPGNVFPGASVPFGMAKIGADVDFYATAGYISNPIGLITSISLFHDTGTGGNESYGNFGSMPLYCPDGEITKCGVTKTQRKRSRQLIDNDLTNDTTRPGYFSTHLEDNTILEATSTRRAGLIRYTWNSSDVKPFISFDWTQNKGDNFQDKGHLQILKGNKGASQILLNGTFPSAWALPEFNYDAFACFDLNADGIQTVDQFGMWSANLNDSDVKIVINQTEADGNDSKQKIRRHRGAIVSFAKQNQSKENTQIILRAGVSFISAEKACQNAKEEIPTFDFDKVASDSKRAWQEKLSRIQLDKQTDPKIKTLFYSSFYRSFLSPNNATGDAPGVYKGTSSPYFDGLFCSWDTYRTFFPLLSLTSPQEYADITETYIDSWRKEGFIVDCRANTRAGFVQGGSDGVNIIADFAVKYKNAALGVKMDEMYAALWNDATNDSKTFIYGGRQINIYEKYGYLPSNYIEKGVEGVQGFQSSKTAEYAVNDFAIRNVALMLGKKEDAERLTKRASFYRNLFDPTVKSLGFNSFMQKRLLNGSFENQDPTFCGPDYNGDPRCGYSYLNHGGFYESSSWEYSFYVPHDFAGLISLVSNNSYPNFIKRLDALFENKIFKVSNEPSFQAPIAYHYANSPTKSVEKVRKLILNDYGLERYSLPGNDDNGAMASLAVFHLLGLYPVPSTKEFLIVSPFVPGYTIRNTLFGTFTVAVNGFDPSTIQNGGNLTSTSKAFVKQVKINGKVQSSRCKILFDDLFPASVSKNSSPINTDLIFEMGTKDDVQDCGPTPQDLPSSLSTGGFSSF